MSLLFLPVSADMEFDCSNYDTVSGVLMEALEATLAMGHPEPWGGYLALTENQEAVGICAFKGTPDEARAVEPAWFTFPPYENRGYGTRMAAHLVRVAAENPDQVVQLIAHTEPEHNASAKICERNGFELLGEIEHPQDGRVWRWSRSLR